MVFKNILKKYLLHVGTVVSKFRRLNALSNVTLENGKTVPNKGSDKSKWFFAISTWNGNTRTPEYLLAQAPAINLIT